jgi:hypothetical protein
MKLIYFSTASLFLLFLLCCTACNDDEEPTLVCENGLEVINDSCQCPANKFLIGNTCRALNDNEYWAIMPVDFPCRDTFFIEFGTIDTVAETRNASIILVNASAFDGIVPVRYYSGVIYFEENTNRKEFYTGGDGVPYCEINGTNTGSYWEGKFISDTEVYIKMYHRNIVNVYDIIDSTEVIFTRQAP